MDYYATLIHRMKKLITQLNIYLRKFPSYERHALCQQIRESAYRVFTLIVEGDKRFKKKTTLTNLNIEHEKLRMLLYVAFEEGYFAWEVKNFGKWVKPAQSETDRRYTTISQMVDEVGRMIGGWIGHEAKSA